jgi:zinc/manganese transport system substrate-binding protein
LSNHIRNRPRRSPHAGLAAVVCAATLMLTACQTDAASIGQTSGASAGTDPLSIVATTTILADVTARVAGDAAEVTAVMEIGADPHNFEASARQLAEMQEADLIVANGANLEEHLLDPLAEAERAGVPVFHATDHIEILTLTSGRAHESDAHEEAAASEAAHDEASETAPQTARASEAEPQDHAHEEGSVDPHFWMDPLRMADVARALGEQIAELSGDADAIGARADDYAAQLERLDRDIDEILEAIPDDARTLVTNHESFNYFADRYGFTVVGTVIPSVTTGAEPSAQDLEALANTIEQRQVTAVFAENTAPEQLAQTLAAEVGTEVQVVELYSDSLGEEGSDAATYVDMLAANAELIRRALGG